MDDFAAALLRHHVNGRISSFQCHECYDVEAAKDARKFDEPRAVEVISLGFRQELNW